jgi:hypothetical protein
MSTAREIEEAIRTLPSSEHRRPALEGSAT